MNNKKHGTEFERLVVEKLAKSGAWVHFLSPDERGAQPFDIIAVKDGVACAIECKTQDAKNKWFPLSRLEDNQVMAMGKWMMCGNPEPLICVQYKGEIKTINFLELKEKGKVNLDEI